MRRIGLAVVLTFSVSTHRSVDGPSELFNEQHTSLMVELSATHRWKLSILKDTSPMRSNGPRAKAAP
jgi:hypothetical protein